MTVLVECPHCSTRVLPMAGRTCPACRKNVDAPPEPKPTPEDLAKAAAVYNAADQIRQGVSPAQVQKSLTAHGVNAADAANLVGDLNRAKREANLVVARRNLVSGAICCIVGIVVTGFTYLASSNAGGGTVIIAWGAILFGGLQLTRGLVQLVQE